VAALSRVVAAFFRRPDAAFERDERLRPGLVVALWTLVAACVVTGLPGLLMNHVVDPAASVLDSPAQWSSAVLSGSGQIATIKTPFDYLKPSELIATAVCLVLGLGLMRALHPHAAAVRRRLTVIATGSVNDYTAYLAVGLVVVIATLLAVPQWR